MADGVAPGAHVAGDAVLADGVSVAPGAVIHAGARIGPGTRVGSCVVIHPDVELGAEVLVEDCVVLGKRPRLRPGSSAEGVRAQALIVGDGVTICSGAVVYAGAVIEPGAIIGDQTQVREGSRVGAGTVLGRGSCIDFEARVGARVRIQTGVYVTGGAVVEDDVFLGPGVCMTNDDTMGRHPRGEGLHAPLVRRAARVGGGVVLVPGVEIGAESFVGAGAVVTRDVAAREVVLGVPARVVRQVEEGDLLERWR